MPSDISVMSTLAISSWIVTKSWNVQSGKNSVKVWNFCLSSGESPPPLADNVSWLVDTVHVTEGSSDREVRRDWRQCLVHGKDGLWFCVEQLLVGVLVVDTVFLTTGDTDLHFKPLAHLGHSGEIFHTCGNVLVVGLLRQVKHVRREQWLTVELVVLFISIEHTIEPWQKLFGTVIGVQDNWDTVCWSNGSDVVSSCNGTGNRSLLAIVLDTLTGEVSGTTVGSLQNDWGVVVSSSLQSSNHGR
ncbi:hypothetical protein OGATHE_000901 [Ogataea polymorpha]|uniref:Uncharacterized protein n=1 Tax=Ogataea polymorpha TaxID=460523 RepID=A0A9P8PTQ6_9ASCO|nr:hypothetical protein OGATHE_000901 [Ogataea polymorpha]